MKNLIVFGSSADPHVGPVARNLVTNGVNVYFYDVSNQISFSQDISKHVRDCKPGMTLTDISGGSCEVDPSASAIWMRNKTRVWSVENADDQVRDFFVREMGRYLRYLIRNFELSHFNSIHSAAKYEDKLAQLKLAVECGLSIPKTLVSNEREAIKRFIHSEGYGCVAKPCFNNSIKPIFGAIDTGSSILTNIVSLEEIEEESDESIAISPLMYQENITKAYELRAVATRYGVCAYRFDTERSELGKVDSRRAIYEHLYRPCSLEAATKAALQTYLRKADLQYGVFDLIAHRTSGAIVFLECNIDGQWAWLERECNTRDITDMLSHAVLRYMEEIPS